MARTPVIPFLQNPYQGAGGPAESPRVARAVTVSAFAIGAALAGGVLMSQAAYADEPGGTTCEIDQDGNVVNSADGTACTTSEEAAAEETVAPEETDGSVVAARTSAEPAGAAAGRAVPDGGERTLFADASTGVVYDPDGTQVSGAGVRRGVGHDL